MSPTKVNGSSPPSASEILDSPEVANLEADIAQLNALLSQESLSGEDDANIIALLQRLESADGVAQGVESKLDGIIGELDSLISSLESKDDAVDDLVGQPPATGHHLVEGTSTDSA